MRREDFSLNVVVDGAESDVPTLRVTFDGSPDELREWLEGSNGTSPASDETDLSFRLNDALESSDATGVLALTDRITGEYVLEVDAPVVDVVSFVRAARERDDRRDEDAEYLVRLLADDQELARYEKRTLLVYGVDGELLRQHSLIPSGVEI